jgi:hypothetical protein
MTPTLRAFAKRLAELQGHEVTMTFSPGPPPVATIKAQDERVGDLTIYDDGDELTVDVGHKHHTHVSSYNYVRHPETERLDMVAHDAASYVNDIMCDRVCFTVDFRDDRCIGSSNFYIDEDQSSSSLVRGFGTGVDSGKARSERYVWSGPID